METTPALVSQAFNSDGTCNVSIGSELFAIDRQDYMFVVMVVFTTEVFKKVCTGSFVSVNLVLTLATCLLFHRYDEADPNRIQVKVGTSVLHAISVIVNPNYYVEDPSISKAFDFGLITVKRSPLKYYPPLATRTRSPDDIINSCSVISFASPFPCSLNGLVANETDVDVDWDKACSDGWRICLRLKSSIPCAMEHGAPMICDGALYALYSARHIPKGCEGRELISTFSFVHNVRDWIDHIQHPLHELDWLTNPFVNVFLFVFCFVAMFLIYLGLMQMLQRFVDKEVIQEAEAIIAESETEELLSTLSSVWSLDNPDNFWRQETVLPHCPLCAMDASRAAESGDALPVPVR